VSSSGGNPKITIITACLNAVRTVEQTLLSVLNQNYPNLEYIIIDGGSTDGTLDIVRKYEARLSRVISEPDKGIYDAFNKGLRCATGELIGILNADDFYAPWALRTIAAAYVEHTECDVFFGKIVVIDEENDVWKVYQLGSSQDLTDRMSLSHPAVFVPKKTYDKWGMFDKSYKIAADWDYLLRLYMGEASFCPVNEVLTAFRVSGASSVVNARQLDEQKRIYRHHLAAREAFKKIIKMKLKYYVRRLLKASNTYEIYAKYRDRRISFLDLSGKLSDGEASIWRSLQEKSIDLN
jgi:glycosyltransferase involved in cell wall biosynthesis